MRRRRKNNWVLAKTMLISFGIVLLMLPILGYLGAFKAVKQQYMEMTMVQLPPPPPVPKDARAKKAHPHAARSRGSVHIAGSSKALPVHVAAAAASPSAAGDDDNSVVNGANTDIGQAPPTSAPPATAPATVAAAPPPPPVAAPAPAPPAAPAEPAVIDEAAAVIPDTQIKPDIPDDLRDSDLDTQFRAVFTVHPDGSADVKMVDSTGNSQLDQLALQAARQWRFHPAEHEGKAVESYLRLVVEFQVS